MEAISELSEADMKEWTNDLVHEVGEKSREKVRALSGWQVVRKEGKR